MDTTNQTYHLSPVDFDPFAGPELLLIAPSTEPQIEIWLSCKFGGAEASCAYNESFALNLQGKLDADALKRAIESLVNRHEALRSTFSPNGAKMCIYSYLQPDLNFDDLSDKAEVYRRHLIDEYVAQNMQQQFDLVNGPLMRVKIFKLAADQHQLILTLHHIICDGWSFGVILQELGQFYSAYAADKVPDLPVAPKYSQYAVEQADFTAAPDYKETEQFWLNKYKGNVPVTDMPVDHPRPEIRAFASKHYKHSLDESLTAAIKKLAVKSGNSLITTLLVAFEVWLQNTTGQRDVVVGVPAAGQTAIGEVGLVGHCVNLLPVKSTVDGESTFLQYLKGRRSEILDAYDHQMITFGTLLKKLNIGRDPSRVPLVPVVFNSDMGMDMGINFHNLTHQLVAEPRRFENFEIFINVNDIGSGLHMDWSYNAGLFGASSIEAMMLGFESLLQKVTAEPELLIKTLSGVEEATADLSLSELNNTAAAYPREKPLHQLISDIAKQYPTNTAVKFGERVISYRELDRASNRLAALLMSTHVLKGDLVALAVDRSAEMVIALLAILKAGAAYLPIDPEYPVERVKYILNDASVKVLITSENYKGHFETEAQELLIEDAMIASSEYPDTPVALEVHGTDLAYVLYTSGSTGHPKGVQIAHYNLVNFLVSMQREPGMKAGDKLLAVTTVSFDIAGLELYLPLITGACVYILDADSARDGRVLLQLIRQEQITVMQATPYTWKIMLESGWNEKLPLKILCGGEALPKDLALKLLEKCSELWNMYGPTETTIWSTVKKVSAADQIITIGKPIANTQVYILDDNLKQVSPGSTGEIYIGGDGVAPGYFNRSELTAERFILDPFATTASGKIYRTGDNGRILNSGEIQCLGRVDHQVKIRGYRIETGEVAFHVNRLKHVKDSVVVARPDPSNNINLVAYVVTRQKLTTDTGLQIKDWRDELKKVLLDYMVPQYIMVLDEFPLTPNGKIDTNALPEPDYTQNRAAYVPPRTSIEQQVAEIWKKYLNIDKISIYDDFFELGGHSLTAVEIMTALEKETGKNLPLASLFSHSTVEKLALLLKMDGKSVTWDSLVPIKPLGDKMPLYIVHGAGLNVLLFNTLAMNMDANQPVYGLQAYGMNGIDEPHRRMEDIAGHYVAEIIAQNPVGPYALAGYSFGGIIAYEMARQLDAMGKEVKMLAMFDTYAYRSDYFDAPLKKWFNRIWFLIKQLMHSVVLLMQNPKETYTYKKEMLKRRVIRKYWDMRYGKEQKQEGFFGYANKIDVANEEAERNYSMKPYPIAVEIFRAQKHTFYMDDFKYLGWKPYALKGVHVHDIPGEHNKIFAPPNDKVFARILQECLNKAQE
ncbi:amino acid adenylation domain-containing protein [Mucilaginibacter mali]|uniref:Amino acid adenylation domain-containing protein n=1 Tax=Mucilaginibacter mali TaxID=2740462 RepID=A0A7D4QER0_9SPHI|nr:non-ribosomal peptide synthetase [Mucilaginibacter mali]QKJ32204.1 amino acid adenylation domain-containing protein [Mucilaginibacter mali]